MEVGFVVFGADHVRGVVGCVYVIVMLEFVYILKEIGGC